MRVSQITFDITRKSGYLSGDFGRNAHKGRRWHSMQSFGGPFHSKITWAGTGYVIEKHQGCAWSNSAQAANGLTHKLCRTDMINMSDILLLNTSESFCSWFLVSCWV